MDWSWLLVLVCPLMMVFMMVFGMKGHGHGHASHSKHSKDDHEIQTQINELKMQNEELRQELQKIAK
ncbi:DUF2933 domain-containing protein [Paenibacillus pinistramenti]|uniref:DUF2933 domain-containing protein n=1 Tax=Paenibacillus pinistramenti TaxID=1768003 RepID=UPI001108A177|nr:DUF2933 domain-containing protein [Paenibacillus pinistramenti]